MPRGDFFEGDKRMQLRSALLVASLLALPAAAIAQPITGPYVSLGAGASIFQDQSIRNLIAPNYGFVDPDPGHISYSVYVGGEASAGWGFGNGFRAEISGVYDRAKAKDLSGYTAGGFADSTGIFANVIYDFDLTPFGMPGLSPYVGAGGGYEMEHLDGPHATSPLGNYLELDGTRGTGALDALVGVAYNIAYFPGLAVTAEYRFTAAPGSVEQGGVLNFAGAPGSSYTREKLDNGLFGHLAMVGFRYALWQPPAPPPPAPPPPVSPPPPAVQPVRTYLVFFDWDRADLTVRAKQIVAEAASASTHVQTTQIEVNGYTDLSGTVAYNDRLSVRRAKSVEAELIRDGVPAGEISIHGYGESNPLVPTAQGVREPQNRRVEIILK
jgi:outer membrane protein OmpA-like peptidoglycan-associated protein